MLSESSFLYCVFREVFFLSERGGMWYLVFIICLPFCSQVTMKDEAESNQIPTLATHNSNLNQMHICCDVYYEFCIHSSIAIQKIINDRSCLTMYLLAR